MHVLNKFLMVSAFTMSLAFPAFGFEIQNNPFGNIPSECTIAHPSGTTIEETESGVRAAHPDGSVKVYSQKKVCVDFFNKKQAGKKEKDNKPDSAAHTQKISGTVLYNSVDKHMISEYAATYIVPSKPPSSDGKMLAYWIGLQDYGGANKVIQPVLLYYKKQWIANSVQCCFGGFNHYANTWIMNIHAGQKIEASILWNGKDTYIMKMALAGQESVLQVKPAVGDIYNWAGAALEPIGIDSCTEFPEGSMTFADLQIESTDGPVTPDWDIVYKGSCVTELIHTDDKIVIQTNITKINGFSGAFAPNNGKPDSNAPENLVNTINAPDSIALKNYAQWAVSGSTFIFPQGAPNNGSVSFSYDISGVTAQCPGSYVVGSQSTLLNKAKGTARFTVIKGEPFGFALNGQGAPKDFGCRSKGKQVTMVISEFVFTYN